MFRVSFTFGKAVFLASLGGHISYTPGMSRKPFFFDASRPLEGMYLTRSLLFCTVLFVQKRKRGSDSKGGLPVNTGSGLTSNATLNSVDVKGSVLHYMQFFFPRMTPAVEGCLLWRGQAQLDVKTPWCAEKKDVLFTVDTSISSIFDQGVEGTPA